MKAAILIVTSRQASLLQNNIKFLKKEIKAVLRKANCLAIKHALCFVDFRVRGNKD